MTPNTEHCPGSSPEDLFRARIGLNYRLPAVAKPREAGHLTNQQYQRFLRDRYNHYHEVGGVLGLGEWLKRSTRVKSNG